MLRGCIKGLLLSGLFLFNTLMANDMAIGGHGATLVPIKVHSIQMHSEHIVITGSQLTAPYAARAWHYRCSYEFKNDTNKDQSVHMGFPYPVITVGYLPSTPPGVTHKDNRSMLYHFVTRVDNQSVITKPVRIQPGFVTQNELAFTHAYGFHVRFKPKQQVNIVHQFMSGVTHDPKDRIWAHYILHTGKYWDSEAIHHVVLDVIPKIRTRLCTETTKSPHPSIQPQPKGLTILGKGAARAYHWDITRFTPNEDLSLCLETAQSFVHHHYVLPIGGLAFNKKSPLWSLNKADYEFMLRAIKAQYGKVFKDPKWAKAFSQQWWYQPDTSYNSARLTDQDQSAIKWLRWRLAQLGARKG